MVKFSLVLLFLCVIHGIYPMKEEEERDVVSEKKWRIEGEERGVCGEFVEKERGVELSFPKCTWEF